MAAAEGRATIVSVPRKIGARMEEEGGSVDSTTPFERIISGMMTGDVDGGWARYNETKTRMGG